MKKVLGILVLLAAAGGVVWSARRHMTGRWVLPRDVVPVLRSGSGASPGEVMRLNAGLDRTTGTPAVRPTGQPAAAAVAATRAEWSPDVIPGEYVLGFYDARDRAAFLALAKAKGVRILDTMDLGHAVRIHVSDERLWRELLAEGPTPLDYGSNFSLRPPDPPSEEPRAPETGYVPFGDTVLRWLGVPGEHEGWGRGVIIAVLDTGVGEHPSLSGVRLTRLDLTGTGGAPGAHGGHGTAVASLIAGRDAVSGMAPSADILSIRVMTDDGVGDTFTLARGIVEAVNRGAQVLSISLGSRGSSFVLQKAVDYALQRGVAVVAAAGNDGVEGASYPARYEGVVAVTAVDASGRLLYYANRGAEIALAAPGYGVLAAGTGGQQGFFSGTSAAVPYVSSAVAALLSERQSSTGTEAVRILEQYVRDMGAPGRDEEFGYGALDLQRVLNRGVPGIYDMTVARPHLNVPTEAGGAPSVVIYAQNRGTEVLAKVQLEGDIDGVPFSQAFDRVAVGESVGREFALDRRRLETAGSVTVRYAVTIVGQADANPLDNAGRGVLSVTVR